MAGEQDEPVVDDAADPEDDDPLEDDDQLAEDPDLPDDIPNDSQDALHPEDHQDGPVDDTPDADPVAARLTDEELDDLPVTQE